MKNPFDTTPASPNCDLSAVPSPAQEATPAEIAIARKTFAIRVLGVGGAGGNAVAHLARETFSGVSFAVFNTDAAALAQCPVPVRVNLGAKSMRGLGAGGDPERGRAAAEEDATQIRSHCEGADIVFVVAGLGGGTGTGAGPVVARLAKESGALVLAVVILPFDCEGTRRQRQALIGLHDFKEAADGVICLPNQKVLKLIDDKTSLLEAFHITNEFVAQGVRAIWRLLARPGLINVDFADLCAVTRGSHSESSLATVEARGENRVREVIERLLAHPLIDGGQALSGASAVLVSIAGGPDLTMTEVNRLMEQINRHCENAHLILGAAVDEELRERLVVTLVAARKSAPARPSGRAVPGEPTPDEAAPGLTAHLTDLGAPTRPPSRFVAPPPESTPENAGQLLRQQSSGARQRRQSARMLQGQLPLEIISKGRFEKSEPTIHQGQDLDVPTYIRRGVALN
ncbi:MAG TPA: cell division protein FtsZ [Methylomirabilota bacterium]|nr:cell division protein FtsZ [Methylomirabilota bacterium]